MHIARVLSQVPWSHHIAPGEYYLEDHNAAELLWASRAFGEVGLQFAEIPKFDPNPFWSSGSSVLVVRVGGFGDLIWLNPIYDEMRKNGVHVAHSCFDRYAPVLDGFIDEYVRYPLAKADFERFQTVVWLENVIEAKACIQGEHPAARLQKIFLSPTPLPKCGYRLKPEEREAAIRQWPRGDKKRVAVQMGSSGATKNYPHMPKLLAEMFEAAYEILLVGEPRANTEPIPENVFDCTQRGFSIRESIAMAAQCDAIVAPDSVFVHVGAALGIPVVGLYGPFCGATYMQDYRGVAMQGRGKCSPCSWHPRGTAFPPDGPCAKTGYCNALGNIPPAEILFMLKQTLK
jgi:hypothetical protein